MAKRRKRKRGGRKREDTLMLVMAVVFTFGFLFYAMDSLPNIEQYVSLAQSIVVLVLIGVALYYAIVIGRQLIEVITVIRTKERRKVKIEDQFAAVKLQKRLENMSWQQFEHYVGHLFARQGYQVEVTQAQGDQGIDAKLYKNGKTYVVQVKLYGEKNLVGRPEVQGFVGAMMGYDGGFFVTSSRFTLGARDYAATIPNLELIDGAELYRIHTAVMPPQMTVA